MSESTTTDTDRAAETAAPSGGAELADAPDAQLPGPATDTNPAVGVTPGALPLPDTSAVPGAGAPGKPRRVLRAVGRWTAAVTVFGLLGTGIALGITSQERTDLPGLATEHDGRWDYPRLVLPALPSGAPRPFAEGNTAEIHHADVRDLLLPAPAGATAAEDLPSIEGEWVGLARFAKVFAEEDRAEIEQRLTDDAVRHIAARGWTMPDGTRTGVYLLQFNSAAYPGDFYLDVISAGFVPDVGVAGTQETIVDEGWPAGTLVPNVFLHTFDEAKPRGEEHVRSAYLTAGDTLAVIVQSRKGTAEAVPFQQTVILQSQLLG